MQWKKLICGILTVAVLCSCMLLSACGSREPVDPNAPAWRQSWPDNWLQEPTLQEHDVQYAALVEKTSYQVPDSSGTVLRLYYDDTNSMRGFVNPMITTQQKTAFVYSIDAAIDTASKMVDAPTNGIQGAEAYILKPDAKGVLRWTVADIYDELQAQFCKSGFYTGNPGLGDRPGTLTEGGVSIGPLSRLFQDGATPFESDGLTVIVSDLMEQNYDLATLKDGIQAYFDQNDYAAATILGCVSQYEGDLSVPCFGSDKGTDIMTIEDYAGPAAYYVIVVGPRNLVDTYVDGLAGRMDQSDAQYIRAEYCNSIHADDIVAPIAFELLPDTMEGIRSLDDKPKKGGNRGERGEQAPAAPEVELDREYVLDDVLGSANTSALYERDEGNAALAQVGRSTSVAFGSRAQIAMVADMEPGTGFTVQDSTLYVYDETQQAWQEGSKNAQAAYSLAADRLQGPVYEINGGQQLVAEGRDVAYLRCALELDGTVLERGKLYHIQVALSVTRDDARTDENNRARLGEMSITTSDFDRELSGLTTRGTSVYSWSGSTDEARARAQAALVCTPKLNILLDSMENITYHPGEADVMYVDFYFSTSEAKR